jgi:L-ribulose-5-phosphate 3-epimerase
MDLAKRLGLTVVVCDAGEVHDAVQRRETLRRLAQAGDYADGLGLTLALEIHPNIVGSGRAARFLMSELNHPQVRINYDTSNILFFSDLDPVEDLQDVVSFVAAVHLKDKATRLQRVWDFVPLGQGVVDFPAVIDVLRKAHFSGPYSIELELAEMADEAAAKIACEEGLRASLAHLREIGLLPG